MPAFGAHDGHSATRRNSADARRWTSVPSGPTRAAVRLCNCAARETPDTGEGSGQRSSSWTLSISRVDPTRPAASVGRRGRRPRRSQRPASAPPRGPPCAAAGSPSRWRPARPACRARGRARAAARSSPDKKTLRDESARPSGSRTVGQATISSGRAEVADHLLDHRDLLRVLAAEIGTRAAARSRTAGCRPSPRRGNGRVAPRPPAPRPAFRGRPRCRSRGGRSRSTAGTNSMSTPAASAAAASAASSRGIAGQVLRRAELCGIDEQADHDLVVGRPRGAIRARCPAWKAPMVGTRPMDRPASRSRASNPRTSATVWTSFTGGWPRPGLGRAAPGRAPVPPAHEGAPRRSTSRHERSAR